MYVVCTLVYSIQPHSLPLLSKKSNFNGVDMKNKVALLALGAACTSIYAAETTRKLCSTTHVASNPRLLRAAEPRRKFVLHLKGGGSTAVTPKNDGVGMAPSIFNLMKNILGAGVLALPAGVAAFSDSKTALAPALALTATLGLTSGYCFSTIGRLCESKYHHD